jgi:sterol desaturase/sphingolipid hydroxylase (fatty acid hydroxylase superfamily)
VPPLLVLGLQVLTIHYQAWVHTDMIGPLGVLDRVFNTPANHRVHHDVESSRGPVNLGAILIVWDRLFGTYEPPREVRRYGLAGSVSPDSVLSVYLSPLARVLDDRRAA